MTKRKTIAEHAADVLRETDNPAVMFGDCGLLDMIFTRAGMKDAASPGSKWKGAHPLDRHRRVLDALEGSPLFTKEIFKSGFRGNPRCRLFRLKEQP